MRRLKRGGKRTQRRPKIEPGLKSPVLQHLACPYAKLLIREVLGERRMIERGKGMGRNGRCDEVKGGEGCPEKGPMENLRPVLGPCDKQALWSRMLGEEAGSSHHLPGLQTCQDLQCRNRMTLFLKILDWRTSIMSHSSGVTNARKGQRAQVEEEQK